MQMSKQVYNNLGMIVAMGKNREIGYNNQLIWRIKEDLTFFKNTTMNSHVIMGRNTYNSMPKNLPGRQYIVLSQNKEYTLEKPKIVCHSPEEVLKIISSNPTENFWVIGGGVIYKIFLPNVSSLWITEIDSTFPLADTYFPAYNEQEWTEQSCMEKSENNLIFRHKCLKRVKEQEENIR